MRPTVQLVPRLCVRRVHPSRDDGTLDSASASARNLHLQTQSEPEISAQLSASAAGDGVVAWRGVVLRDKIKRK